jgi:hypothetical protein
MIVKNGILKLILQGLTVTLPNVAMKIYKIIMCAYSFFLKVIF